MRVLPAAVDCAGGPLDEETISVVVPLYNKSSHILRALRSIVDQSVEVLEIIVVDDGSTDDGPELVLGSDDPRVHLHRQRNSGPGSARNAGLALARGRFVAFLDADDEWKPEFLARTMNPFRENPEVAMVATDYQRWPAPGRGEKRDQLSGGIYRLKPTSAVELFEQIHESLAMQFTLIRTDIARFLGGYFDLYPSLNGEDTFFMLKILLNATIWFVPEELGIYHTEASELFGVHSEESPPPLQACFTNPEELYSACPPEMGRLLEQFLARHALHSAVMYAKLGQQSTALRLIQKFADGGRGPTVEVARVKLLATVSPLLPHARRFARALRRRRSLV